MNTVTCDRTLCHKYSHIATWLYNNICIEVNVIIGLLLLEKLQSASVLHLSLLRLVGE